ncbi:MULTISPECIES: hypothetical protein [unclassified Streptomyces]|uniref:hypothetical protein n=1 Tax=unclassified Streptomyces TaxID=2593676 RepID=UPI001906DB2C|nr:hypothetical protein [Streptomyces sp. HSG2]
MEDFGLEDRVDVLDELDELDDSGALDEEESGHFRASNGPVSSVAGLAVGVGILVAVTAGAHVGAQAVG